MGKYTNLLILGALSFVFFSCDASPKIDTDKLWPCETDSDCGGDCVCLDGQVCVPSEESAGYGACAPCEYPEADCDDSPATGCETTLDSKANCGACGVQCADYQECNDGKCEGCIDSDNDGYDDKDCGGTDCDDSNQDIHPGAHEVCGNDIDEDCNGHDLLCDCDDADNDGFYDGVCGGTDCDDSNPDINPGADEITCNGSDENCNDEDGIYDDAPDGDTDGFDICAVEDQGDTDGKPADCDDSNDSINPGAHEICGNDTDEDCSGDTNDLDEDQDGFVAFADSSENLCGGTDCNDNAANINPGQTERCGNNADEDCSGHTNDLDEDQDGFVAVADSNADCGGTDCDDSDPDINPNAREIPCNDVDENCNGNQDDNPDMDGDGYFLCGTDEMNPDCDDSNPDINPDADESLSGDIGSGNPCFDCLDNDCDGTVDCADIGCKDSDPACNSCSDQDHDNWPECSTVPGDYCNDCDPDPDINPGADEICGNKVDENCDGNLDEIDRDGDEFFAEWDGSNSPHHCDIDSQYIDCDDHDPWINPNATEICDGLDNDCDGLTDNVDTDGDGASACDNTDCNDSNPSIHKGADEVCNDNMDNDCDGDTDCADPDCMTDANVCPDSCSDTDGDGWADCGANGPDCDDDDPRVYPGQLPLCNDNDNNDCQNINLRIQWFAGQDSPGNKDDSTMDASFDGPTALSMGEKNFDVPVLYVADTGNNTIREINLNTTDVITVAGINNQGIDDYVDHGTMEEVSLKSPSGLLWLSSVIGNGFLLVADTENHVIRLVNLNRNPGSDDDYIVTIAGDGESGYEDGSLHQAEFHSPQGITIDEFGNIYIADTGNHCIRKISRYGWVSTFTGQCGESGFVDGTKYVAMFDTLTDITYVGDGVFLVTDTSNHRIRYVTADGAVTTLVGAQAGFANGYSNVARMQSPGFMVVDLQDGEVLFSDMGNFRIRVLQPVPQENDIWTGTLAGGGVTQLGAYPVDACEADLGPVIKGLALHRFEGSQSSGELYLSSGNKIFQIILN